MEETPKHKGRILLAIGIGTFMTALDTNAVNTILPLISQVFSQCTSRV